MNTKTRVPMSNMIAAEAMNSEFRRTPDTAPFLPEEPQTSWDSDDPNRAVIRHMSSLCFTEVPLRCSAPTIMGVLVQELGDRVVSTRAASIRHGSPPGLVVARETGYSLPGYPDPPGPPACPRIGWCGLLQQTQWCSPPTETGDS